METPDFDPHVEIRNRNINIHKEFVIEYNNSKYTLRIEVIDDDLIFKLSKIDELLNYIYENKYDYLSIINKLKLSNKTNYDNLNKILELFGKIYNINKFQVKIKDENSLILNIIFRDSEIKEEENHEFRLYKKFIDVDDKFNLLFNQISLLQDNKNKKNDEIEKLNDRINKLNIIVVKKDEEIKKLIKDKDNIINDLKLKIIKQQNEIDELKHNKNENNNINDFNKINNKINILGKEINAMKESILDIKNKYILLDKLVNYPQYNRFKDKMDYKFNKNPKNLKYKKDIVQTNTYVGWNDLFEVFTSFTDGNEYLVSPNKNNYNIDIISLKSNEVIKSLEGHMNDIRTVRYFINKKYDEYLVSADDDKIIIVWDITNNYNIKHKINTNYGGVDTSILSNLLIFNEINGKNFIITSSDNKDIENERAATKMYSLDTAEFIKYLGNTNDCHIYFLLSWYNIKKERYLVIQFSCRKIIISDPLEDELYYSELRTEIEENYMSGFIYKNNNKDYLCSSSDINVQIWDLFEQRLVNTIRINNELAQTIQWNDKYGIVADYNNKSFKIIDLDQGEVVKNIGGEHESKVICVKKVLHPDYGESLLSSGEDGIIKIWSF